MTEYKLLKIMKSIADRKNKDVKISEVHMISKLDEYDFDVLIDEVLTNGYIQATSSVLYLESGRLESDYRITNKGENFLKQQSKLNNRFIFIELRNWMTLLIALAAFIKSFYF